MSQHLQTQEKSMGVKPPGNRRDMFRSIAAFGLGAVVAKIPQFKVKKATEWIKPPFWQRGDVLEHSDLNAISMTISQLQLEVHALKTQLGDV